MWWSYLEMHRGSTLFPHPWRVWAVRAAPDAKVLEIASASEWVDFVSADASSTDGLLYPDWNAVAGHWHAIHMTVAAIAATQGIRFSLGRRVVAPPYWDVESTLWLRWVFTEISDEDGYQPSREG
jgi:hypothetical protein